MNKKEYKVIYTKGSGPGGQNVQKNETACTIIHIESGIKSYCCDERSRSTSYKKALKELEKRIKDVQKEEKAKERKSRRDFLIHNTVTVRTYDFKRNEVRDHRTGKRSTIDQILNKGNLEKLR